MIPISALGFLYRRQHSLGVNPRIVVPTITTSWSLETFCSSVHLSLHPIWIREVVIRVVEIVVWCTSGDLLTQVLETSNVGHNGVNLYIREWSEEPWRSMCFQHQGELQSVWGFFTKGLSPKGWSATVRCHVCRGEILIPYVGGTSMGR